MAKKLRTFLEMMQGINPIALYLNQKTKVKWEENQRHVLDKIKKQGINHIRSTNSNSKPHTNC